MQPGLGGVQVDTGVFRPATFIDSATRNVGLWLLILVVLVVTVIGGLLGSWRAALIAFVGITASLITALYVLYLFGVGYNLLVLAGLSVALLAMIDDVVVGSRWRVPLGFAAAVPVLAMIPIFFIGGWAAPLARSLAEAYVTAVAASILVALTVTPALDGLLPASRPDRAVPLRRLAAGWHRFVVRPLAARRWRTAAALAVLLLAALALLPQLSSKTLIPTVQDRNLLVHLQTTPGTSVLEMSRITGIESADLRGIAGVAAVGSHVGRAVMSDQAVDVNQSELWVRLADSADYSSTVSTIKRLVAGYPGVTARVETYEQDRIDAVRTDAAQSAPVVVHVFGPDFTGLKDQADRVRAAISGVSGIVDARTEAPAEQPTLTVSVNLPAAQQSGIKPGDVRRTASTYFAGLLVGSFYEDQRVFDVVVWGTPSSRATPANLVELQVPTPSGGSVRLGDVATVKVTAAPAVITHTQSSRVIDVTASVNGRDLPSVLRDVRARLATMPMPLEFHSEVSSDVAAAEGSDLRTLWLIAGAAIVALLMLQAAFSSWRLAALVLVLTPLSVVGGLLTAPLVGGLMSLGALLGLLAVFGLAVRNAVVVVHRLRASADLPEVLEPVLLSTAAVAASMVPVLILGDVAGLEVLHPFAAVVLGGLVSSTVVTGIVLPALTGTGQPAVERHIPLPREAPAPVRSGADIQGPLARSITRPPRAALALLLCAAALSGCTGGTGEPSTAPAATTVAIPGTDVKKLVLTADAVQRVGIKTQPIAASGAQTSIPMSAVYYDNTGVTWVYTNPAPLTYVRVKVTLAGGDGETAILSAGPPVGTEVVTVGEPELYGVEYGVAGEQ
jgi:Cu/Ag efflux pump CusA